jgi:hypothetical protein
MFRDVESLRWLSDLSSLLKIESGQAISLNNKKQEHTTPTTTHTTNNSYPVSMTTQATSTLIYGRFSVRNIDIHDAEMAEMLFPKTPSPRSIKKVFRVYKINSGSSDANSNSNSIIGDAVVADHIFTPQVV